MKPSMILVPCVWVCALWLPWAESQADAPTASAHPSRAVPVVATDALTHEAEDDVRSEAEGRYWREVAERLLAGQPSPGACPAARDAGSCVLAARLLMVVESQRELATGSRSLRPPRDRVRALLASAAARAHEDPMLSWAMTTDVFKREFPELRERALIELRRSQPDNLQVWLMSLADEDWTGARLQAAARSTRFEARLYVGLRADLERLAAITADAPAVDGLPFEPTAVESMQVILTGLLMAEAMPGLQGLIETCAAADPVAQAERHADCWRIAERLSADAESVIDLALGSALMARIARDPRQRERAAQARLDYEYLQQGILESLKSAEQLRRFLQRIREPGGTEISAARLTLLDAGLPAELPIAR